MSATTTASELNRLHQETQLLVPRFNFILQELSNDIMTISTMPPIPGIRRSLKNGGIDAIDGSSVSLWIERLETIFHSFMTTKPYYTQMRYIGVADNGRELVRVNRVGDKFEDVKGDKLQSKGDEFYFKEALTLEKGQVYFSPVTLNRENGVISEPRQPVIRVLIPLHTVAGEYYGMIVINADYDLLFEGILNNLSADKQLLIVNNDGDYVVYDHHGKESGLKYEGAGQAEKSVMEFIVQSEADEGAEFFDLEIGRYVFNFTKIHYDKFDSSRFLALAYGVSEQDLLQTVTQVRHYTIWLILLVLCVSLLCVAFQMRVVVRPIRRMIEGIRAYGEGRSELKLPLEYNDEIGEMARAFKDLTHQLDQASKAEASTLARLQAIVDNTVDGLITIDEKGIVVHYNKACEDLFGYKANQVIGKNIKMLMPSHFANNHDQYLLNYHKTGEEKIIGSGREVEAQRKDGSIFPIDLSVSKVLQEGDKIYFSGIVRDISVRKKSEEEILRSNQELERFAYIASHDLKEPLRMLSNFTGLLQHEYAKEMDETASQYMSFIMDASKRMQVLVSDLLEYSRIGTADMRLQEFEGQMQLNLVLENFQSTIKDLDAEITYDPLPLIYANPVQFSRLLQNLIGNAMKYQREGVNPIIHIGVKEEEDNWLIAIKDNGIGIKEEYLEQIFVIFKRLHNKNEYTGTGIGLAVCKKIVNNFGGDIWAESEIDKGTTFYFTIPKKK